MKLIIGLGNPGPEYAKTRHNAGFLAVDRFIDRWNLSTGRSQFHAQIAEGTVRDQRVMVLKPMNFMNRSGLTAGEVVSFFKRDPTSDVMIVVDDVALPCGSIRVRKTGSAGGHNGLKDVQRALGTQDYPRLRIGIDARGRVPQHDYVLGRFTADQLKQLDPALDATCDALECWLEHGVEKAMNDFNGA